MDEYIDKAKLMSHIESESREWGEDYDAEQILGDIEDFPAADVVSASEFRDCRNELCMRCGNYTQAHNGACDDCRWKR